MKNELLDKGEDMMIDVSPNQWNTLISHGSLFLVGTNYNGAMNLATNAWHMPVRMD